MPLRLAKLNVDTIGDTLAMKKANGLFNALDYRVPQVSSYYGGEQRKAEGLKDRLGNKVAKEKTEWP